jgi:hypothetical protein
VLTYDQVIKRLEDIEEDLGKRQNDYEQAAADIHRLIRGFELRMARVKQATKATTETAKKDAALVSIAAADDDLYERLTVAEGRYEGLKAAIRVLEARATIGQSLLKTMTREAPQTGEQPQWTSQHQRQRSAA